MAHKITDPEHCLPISRISIVSTVVPLSAGPIDAVASNAIKTTASADSTENCDETESWIKNKTNNGNIRTVTVFTYLLLASVCFHKKSHKTS